MAEIHRVPLQPLAKGSLTRLWLGIVLLVLIAAGAAWALAPKGVSVEELQAGTGPFPTDEDVVFVKYKGSLKDGTVFDESQPLPIPEGLLPEGTPFPIDGGIIDGFKQGLKQMQKGGKYILEIPSELGYGAEQAPGSLIPPNSDLIFEMEVSDIMARSDFEGRVAMLQQMMQMQQEEQGGAGAPGAPGGPPPPAMGPPPGN